MVGGAKGEACVNKASVRHFTGVVFSAFVASAVVLLLFTSAAKVASAFRGTRDLQLPDPVLEFVTTRHLFLTAAVGEVVVVLVSVWGRSQGLQLSAIAWISSLFLLYRIGHFWLGLPVGRCPCLGNATDWLHLSPHSVDLITKLVLIYLVGGSCILLFALRLSSSTKLRLQADARGIVEAAAAMRYPP
jgi:hypothetical protein